MVPTSDQRELLELLSKMEAHEIESVHVRATELLGESRAVAEESKDSKNYKK